MRRKTTLSVLGLGAVGLFLYRFRRQLFGRLLGLRPARHEVTVVRGLPLTMPDGVVLVADFYRPKAQRLFPTILIRTPYGRGRTVGVSGLLPNFIAQRFAERGYNVIVQDVRGRFESGGDFKPFEYESRDGRATLDWIGKQSWFNGVLGMWGQSYVGYIQWAVAGQAPLFLKALVPGITGTQLPIAGFHDGALALDMLFRWILQLDSLNARGKFGRVRGWARLFPAIEERILARAFGHLPLKSADQTLVGHPVSFYQDWLAHPNLEDPYWQELDQSQVLPEITASAHLVSGWYDIFLRETISDYSRLYASGHGPYLTIGPWHHLDRECTLETLRQGIIWFDSILKGDRRLLRKLPVRIHVMGVNEWREMESWPPATQDRSLTLQGEGRNGGRLSSGEAQADTYDTYVYDPAHPTPSVGGPLMSPGGGPQDNRKLEARPDVLTFTTDALARDVEVMGPGNLVLYVRSDLENTDFFGRLCDVYPDGRSINVCDGFSRILPGSGLPQPDGSIRIEIDLWPTAYQFRSGHAIRLQVSSGAHPRWNRNLGSGEPLASGSRMKIAHQCLYHDREHPSALFLPCTTGEIELQAGP